MGAEFGHYYTLARETCAKDSEWVIFDDSNISKIKNEDCIRQFFSNSNYDTPYLLFYQKKQVSQKFEDNMKDKKIVLSESLLNIIERDHKAYLQEMENSAKSL